MMFNRTSEGGNGKGDVLSFSGLASRFLKNVFSDQSTSDQEKQTKALELDQQVLKDKTKGEIVELVYEKIVKPEDLVGKRNTRYADRGAGSANSTLISYWPTGWTGWSYRSIYF